MESCCMILGNKRRPLARGSRQSLLGPELFLKASSSSGKAISGKSQPYGVSIPSTNVDRTTAGPQKMSKGREVSLTALGEEWKKTGEGRKREGKGGE